MYATPFCRAPCLDPFAPGIAGADSCPVRVKPFAFTTPTALHGQLRRAQIDYDAEAALCGCVFNEPPITLDLPRVAYADPDPQPAFAEVTHDWTLDRAPHASGSRPPSGRHLVDRHSHLLFLTKAQLVWLGKGKTLIVTTTTDPTNLVWTRDGKVRQPEWRDQSKHPSQKWRSHVHTFAFRNDGWPETITDWEEWGWSRRPGQPR